jgi:D-xylose transport system ATP-binding protein
MTTRSPAQRRRTARRGAAAHAGAACDFRVLARTFESKKHRLPRRPAGRRSFTYRGGLSMDNTQEKRAPILQLQGISKSFGVVRALTQVDFEVYPAEVLGLVGDNGAGKSTLVKVISGTYQPDNGKYFFEGREVHIEKPSDARNLGIQTVYQDLALCDNLDVVANLFLGREQMQPIFPGIKVVDEIEMERAAMTFVNELHVRIPSLRTRIAALSGGQRQSVAVARAVMWNSKVVLLDEPTAALGVEQTHQVKELITRLRDKGLGVVVISHNLADVFEVSDRIIVLRLGQRVATFDTHSSNHEQVVGAITGAEFGETKGTK